MPSWYWSPDSPQDFSVHPRPLCGWINCESGTLFAWQGLHILHWHGHQNWPASGHEEGNLPRFFIFKVPSHVEVEAFVELSDVDYEVILSLCGGLEDLWIFHLDNVMDNCIPLIKCLSLRHLCVSSDQFSVLSSGSRVFSCWTHLSLGNKIEDIESTVVALITLPKLTHLSLDNYTLIQNTGIIPASVCGDFPPK
jgi:hypothetical protein